MAGRPAHAPTDYQRGMVEAMAAYGATQSDMAAIIGVDVKTLRKAYSTELQLGLVKANNAVAGRLYRKAVDQDNLAAQIFWLKARAGWSEKSVVEHTGKDGQPIRVTQTQARDVLEHMTDEEREIVRKFLQALHAAKEVQQVEADEAA